MIGLYLHHHGSGHRTRGTLIAQQLCRLPGAQVSGSGTGPAPPGWPGGWLDLAADDEHASCGHAADVDAGGVLHWSPRHDSGLLRRHAALVAWLARDTPSVVLVDVSVEIALQVRLCGIPVVVTAMPGDRSDRPHRSAYDLAEHLLAPWPAGTHEQKWPARWRSKTVHVGGISRFSGLPLPRPAPATDGVRRVLTVWGAGGTDVDAQALAAAEAATPGWTWTHRGGPHPASLDLWHELALADVVVTHAGLNAVADVACARRPAVVVAQDRPHGEQHATARAVEQLDVATGLTGWPEPQRWPAVLQEAYERGGQRWSRWEQPGAAAAAAQLLRAQGQPQEVSA